MRGVAALHSLGPLLLLFVTNVVNYSNQYFKRMVKNDRDSSSDDSDEDEESLARLREAVDSETLKDNLYSQQTSDNVSETENTGEIISTNHNISNTGDDPSSLSKHCKQFISKSRHKTLKPQNHVDHSKLKSLRRDKQEESSVHQVISELEVTPQFQKFVGNKLDQFLDNQIEDVTDEDKLMKSSSTQQSCMKLLRMSKRLVENIDDENKVKIRKKPDLLAHTKISTSKDDISSCVVSADTILSGEETKCWVNKFENRVEPGVERIKKKKVKKKKRKSDVESEAVAGYSC